jgi:hypothetical protein
MPTDGSRLAKWSPDGRLLWEEQGLEFVSLGNYGREAPDLFFTHTLHRYRLLDRAAGAWEFQGSVFDGKVRYRSDPHGVPRILKMDGADFAFMPTGDGVQVYRIGKKACPPAAMVGGTDPTWDGRRKVKGEVAVWTWSDADGNGAVDPAEVRWLVKPEDVTPGAKPAFRYSTFGMEVDREGHIWFANNNGKGIWRLPRGPADARGNPTYDWSQASEVVPADKTPTRFQPQAVRVAEDGSLYVFGWSAPWPQPQKNPFWMGGSTLARFAKDGRRLWMVRLPEVCVGLDTVPGGGCVAGMAKKANLLHYTPDGLLIGRSEPGEAMGKQSGWLDNQASVAVSRDPRDNRLDVFVEEDYALRIAWYRVDDRDIRTLTGTLKRP